MVRPVKILQILGAAWGIRASVDEISLLADGANDLDKLVLYTKAGNLLRSGTYTVQHSSAAGQLHLPFQFPIRGLGFNDIKPVVSTGDGNEMMCCPQGTIFDARTRSCVFSAADLCPPGFDLDEATMSLCISINPPCTKGLTFENGRCISPDPPGCLDDKAKFDPVSKKCISPIDPVCDDNLDPKGENCVSKDLPTCLGKEFFPDSTGRCVSTERPKCGLPEDNLILHLITPDNKLICISNEDPICPDMTKPVDNQCRTITGPACPEHFENKGGSCVYTKGPCEQGGVFTPSPDDKPPVCMIVEDGRCPDGDLHEGKCLSRANPCDTGYDLLDGQCTRSLPILCPAGTNLKPVFATSDSPPAGSRRNRNLDRDPQPQAFCCPDVDGIEIDASNRCSVRAVTGPCPGDMRRSPDDQDKCVYTPQQVDCERGTLDETTGNCIEKTPPHCPNGELDLESGKCNLGEPNCKAWGPDYVYKKEIRRCVSEKEPVCPPTSTLLGATGDCISDQPSQCSPGSTHTEDGKECVHRAPPKCPEGKGTYDPALRLCVVDNKPVCPPVITNGISFTSTPEGLNCVSPTQPICEPGSGTDFDRETGRCIGRKAPVCVGDYTLNRDLGKCVSIPDCKHLGKEFTSQNGKCVSTDKPLCPPQSTWVQHLAGCVHEKKPCSENNNTPTSAGQCVTIEPPTCNHIPNTTFKPGTGCVSETVPECENIRDPETGATIKVNIDDNGKCVSEMGPSCGKNTDLVPVGDMCVSRSRTPYCPGESQRDPDTQKCLTRSKPQCREKGLTVDENSLQCYAEPSCPDKSTIDAKMARCVTASKRTCFMLLECPGVVRGVPAIEGGEEVGAGRLRI
ncbi:hypothetical protein QBC34DRAFT_179803 [Podospora aff. communis PSN243]|uniref:Cell wall cysteine-rich protein n=1 Tax=Podospora aff. communis PSN243 TaxID=3040156 RepID=A0AAV9GC00_9PEZI|nr:hypothetical protein QBC34DRAFT_179803 [Podospora aff. communis PSN243]